MMRLHNIINMIGDKAGRKEGKKEGVSKNGQ